jgi:hypothetical protein
VLDKRGGITMSKIIAAVYHNGAYDALLIAENGYTEMIQLTSEIWDQLDTIDGWYDNASGGEVYDEIEDLTNTDFGELIMYFDNTWHIVDASLYEERKQFYESMRYTRKEHIEIPLERWVINKLESQAIYKGITVSNLVQQLIRRYLRDKDIIHNTREMIVKLNGEDVSVSQIGLSHSGVAHTLTQINLEVYANMIEQLSDMNNKNVDFQIGSMQGKGILNITHIDDKKNTFTVVIRQITIK